MFKLTTLSELKSSLQANVIGRVGSSERVVSTTVLFIIIICYNYYTQVFYLKYVSASSRLEAGSLASDHITTDG